MVELLTPFAQALYLFAPLLVAAAISGVVLRFDLLPALRYPLDAGLQVGGRRVFGDSKTWRGVVVAVLGCVATAAVQKHLLTDLATGIAVVDYARTDVLSFGLAMGAGAMLGELPNSFCKRRLGIAPGKTTKGPLSILFYVWDQVDLLTAAWPLIWAWVRPSWQLVAASFAVALVAHPSVSLVGYLVGARRSAR